MDKEKAIKLYEKYGIDYSNNTILIDYLNHMEYSEEIFMRIYKFIQNEFFIDLDKLKKSDLNSFNRYVEHINSTKGKINFWGERFELFFHSKLLQGVPDFFDKIRRGKDGLEPDFLLSKNNIELGIELTTLQYKKLPENDVDPLAKIIKCILEKNRKKYVNDKCILAINITNLNTTGQILNYDILEAFKVKFRGFSYLGENKIKFGGILLLNNEFKESENGVLYHLFEPIIGLINENKEMDRDLKVLFNMLYPPIKEDNNKYTYTYILPFV